MREDDEVAPGSGTTREERRRDPSRVLALTDGVFAIIITLLVLDIHVPELTSHESLRVAISDILPSFISFVLAFIVAAMQWVGHRDLFTLIRYTDRGIIWLNLLTLFAVCLLPFARADRGVERGSRIKEDRPAGRSEGKPRTRSRCPCCRSGRLALLQFPLTFGRNQPPCGPRHLGCSHRRGRFHPISTFG